MGSNIEANSAFSAIAAAPHATSKQQRAKLLLAVTLIQVGDHAFAQTGGLKVTSNLDWVKTNLISAGLVVFTVLIIIAGIEVAARHKKLIDVWPLIVGAGISGGASVIAAIING